MATETTMKVQCGAHGCGKVGEFYSAAIAKENGWHYDKRGGYGWICPDCCHEAITAPTSNDLNDAYARGEEVDR